MKFHSETKSIQIKKKQKLYIIHTFWPQSHQKKVFLLFCIFFLRLFFLPIPLICKINEFFSWKRNKFKTFVHSDLILISLCLWFKFSQSSSQNETEKKIYWEQQKLILYKNEFMRTKAASIHHSGRYTERPLTRKKPRSSSQSTLQFVLQNMLSLVYFFLFASIFNSI